MRFLNKIIFINSASIKYAEINLDGNVHFIGTQGVGKSTLLRAILFFYNADKTKLGISREKQNFDSYYFPYQNSYIVFEVVKGNTKYSVLAFKSNNRVAFRFIDSPYKKSYYIDDMGHAHDHWDKIKKAIGHELSYSKKITSYDDYRNILYGNHSSTALELKRYALLESKHYQNIPRTIQNVFLNTKLDADFIKETIINSINDEGLKIDLKTYSENHLEGFEDELNEIKLWSKTNKNGETPVRLQAERVAQIFRQINELKQNKIHYANQLFASLVDIEHQKPNFETQVNALKTQLGKQEKEKQLAEQKYTEEIQDVKTQIGILKKEIKLAKSKKKNYLNIDEIIKRVDKKSSKENEKLHLENQIQILTSHFLEIDQKFKAQIDQLKNQNVLLKNEMTQTVNKLESDFIFYKNDINESYNTVFEDLKQDQEQTLNHISKDLDKKQNEQFELSRKEIECKHKRFDTEEVIQIDTQISTLNLEKQDLIHQVKSSKISVSHFQKEWEIEIEKLQADKEIKSKSLYFDRDKLKSKINELETLLKDSKGSFYDWLNEYYPNWTETIGQIIDQKNTLFSKTLNPTLINSEDDTFFGIKIDFNGEKKTIKTIENYTNELQELKFDLEKIGVQISLITDHYLIEESKLKQNYTSKILKEKDRINTSSFRIEQLDKKLKEFTVNKIDFVNASEQRQQNTLLKLTNELQIVSKTISKLKEKQNEIKLGLKEKIINKKHEKEQKIETYYSTLQVKIKDETCLIEEKICLNNEQINQLKNDEKSELNDQGADTERIETIKANILTIQQELEFIEKNRDLVTEYRKDKKELFDHLDTFLSQKKQFEKKIIEHEEIHEINQIKIRSTITSLKDEIIQIQQKLKEFYKQIDHYNQFKKSEVFTSIEVYKTNAEQPLTIVESTTKIIDLINQNFYSTIKEEQGLQAEIHKFTSHFSENNIFKFKTLFKSKSEYFQFAEMLKEFINEDKISDLEKRVHDRFIHIIGFIGKQTADILSKEDEIQTIITKINKDFVSKNFVGAIKSMELRKVESSNKIMRLLIEIKDFNDEFGDQLGLDNLFSLEGNDSINKKATLLIKSFIDEMKLYKQDHISISDSFGLQFKVQENSNNTGWVEKLTNIGSEGTDILIKAMINIMLLNVFKNTASSQVKDFQLHCMMDEIGKLHPSNIKGILKFANDRNILLINSSPTSYNATNYKYTYILSKDVNHVTRAKLLVKKIPSLLNEMA